MQKCSNFTEVNCEPLSLLNTKFSVTLLSISALFIDVKASFVVAILVISLPTSFLENVSIM
ncbi:hypothetical protein BD780_003370 [Clostridium tetanomorphum]|nr:hypothetical protein [Clostridium tetanomorphum]MBP1863568.1 hypothetical protein [Clostridium tetanomorphum]NRS86145.1 hypothetical protein [Clostridium tetanomorphum]